jgi:hypothetical protein
MNKLFIAVAMLVAMNVLAKEEKEKVDFPQQ